jgi:D-lyxose ketol-isomerase
MIKRDIVEKHRELARQMLAAAGIVITEKEGLNIEIADFGLGRFPEIGLILLVYVNTDRVCAKELIMPPNQNCVQHKHPDIGGEPGKEETFRCRWGKVYLYVDGDKTENSAVQPPFDKDRYYTAQNEIVLGPGDQYVMPPDTWHWFQAGPEGAIISEFSSRSRDELDAFSDPGVERETIIVD